MQSMTFKASFGGASSVFGAAEEAPLSLHLPPRRRMQPAALYTQRLLTFLLSHAFVLPGAAEQHQPHSLSDTELRVRASRLWSTRYPVCDHHRSPPGGRVAVRWSLPAAAHTASSCLHVSAALHSRELLTNEAAEPGRGRHGPANQGHSPVN